MTCCNPGNRWSRLCPELKLETNERWILVTLGPLPYAKTAPNGAGFSFSGAVDLLSGVIGPSLDPLCVPKAHLRYTNLGMNLENISMVLGHSSLEVTKKYLVLTGFSECGNRQD
jgi:hypothetical protein